MFSAMGTRRPRRHEYAPHCFAVRLAAEATAYRYLPPYLARLRGGHYVQPYNAVTFVFVEDLADACRLVLSCVELRLVGVTADDFPAPPADIGGEHYSVRLVIAVEGKRGDPANRRTSDDLAGVTHRFAMSKGRLIAAGDPIVRMHLPTLREAVDLVRACPHLRLAADQWRGSSR
ncbi:hypothetical protein [uncultured Jannaschia sp.]|uniref:hypothetical protein n=1 Tax=uncultured Jannaschia sp. TaxID=293347 RepID=UPI00260D9064|nr:hypothetical protein [uncultured Jannaschia sp.]